MKDRIRFSPLQDKITDPETAAQHIQNGTNLFISGFSAGYPKLIPRALVQRAQDGEKFKINLFAGASTGDSVDGILAEAGLSYVGLGAQPPTPSWGRMLAEAQTMIYTAPRLALLPGLAIVTMVLGLNLLGDGLRDLLDPRLRRRTA